MNTKNIIVVIIVAIVAFIAVRSLNTQTDTGSLSADTSTVNSTDAKYIYSILQKMDEAELDDSVFSNTTFINLKDNTVTFNPQESGRNNPFSPVGSDTFGTAKPI